MNSRQQLLDSLTAHISLYSTRTPDRNSNSNPNPRSAVLRWFSSLSVHQRRAHLTAIDPSFITILLQMKEKLRSNGSGLFILLPDLPQNNYSALPTLCYRKLEGLISRFSESNCAQRAIHDSMELFSSKEGERDVGGNSNEFPCLDVMCVSEGLVADLNQFIEIMDEITNGEFLRGGDEVEMAADWVELGWLKAKGYYSLEEFVVNRIEVCLRLSWLSSNAGKKRGVKLKEKMSAPGVAANVFWRKKGCVDWWEKLDGCMKKKVYGAYLGKAAVKLTNDIIKSKLPISDDNMWNLDDQDKLLRRSDSSFFDIRDIATCRRTYSKTKSSANPVTVPQKLSPLYLIFNSLYILQFFSNLLSAAQCGEYDNLFFSPLDSVNSISDVMLRKLRDLLMVISLDCTKFELLGEGTKSLTKKLNDKPVAPNRKKRGNNQNKKSNPIPRPCQDGPKTPQRVHPAKGKGDGALCLGKGVVRQPSKFDCEIPKKDLTRECLSSPDAMEPAKGLSNGKLRGAPRKSRKERKKHKSPVSNGSEVTSCVPRGTGVSPASAISQPGDPTLDLTFGSSTVKNVTSNGGSQIDKLSANPSFCSILLTDNVDNGYSAETDSRLSLKRQPDLSKRETSRHDSSNCDPGSSTKTCDPMVEHNDSGNSGTDNLGNVKGGEDVTPSLMQEHRNHGLLRVGAMSSPSYISYEWPNIAPFHPSTNTHRPATADRLHLDVGHTLQKNFHHAFVKTLQVRNSSMDNNGYNGIISRPLPMSFDWPPVVGGVNRLVPSVTCNYDTELILRRQSSFQQGITAQNAHCGATSEDERTISSDVMDFPDIPIPQELVDEHDKNWMSEEDVEAHAVSGMDYNQYFGGGVMYWNPSDHPGTSFSRPPSLCSDDSSWGWREADMNRAVDDMVAFSSSYSTNGLTSPSTASFCSPFDPMGSGAVGYVIPGGEIGNKVLHSSSKMHDGGADESVLGSMPNISGDGEMKIVEPYPILRPIIIPSMSRDRSRSEFKHNYDHKSPCVPSNRREHRRIKRPPSPVVLCVPHGPRPPPPSPVGDSRKQRGFPTVRSGSSSPRHWGVKGWFHDGVNFEEACVPMEGSEVVWPSWTSKALSACQLAQPFARPVLQDRLIAISQLAREQEHPDVILPLQPPDKQNCSARKASLALIHDVLHDEINLFCKQVVAENLIRKPYINWAVKRVARSLQVLWPRSRTNIFGSNATGLSLPSSDVDLVVCLPPVRNLEPIKEAGILEGRNGIKETCLQHAARYLANQEWVKSDSLKIVENTAIPIIMLVAEVPRDLISTQSNVQTPNQEADQLPSAGCTHFQTGASNVEGNTSPKWSKTGNDINDEFKSVHIDISFKSATHTGLQTTGLVKDLTERFPAVTPLTLVLKQFLADRSLDQCYSGGLSSYCLILLITRFLQHEHHHGRPTNQNYGSLLMDFLYFFGNVFEPRQMRISVQGSGVYLKRERGCSIDPLCMDDPLFFTNNVGRNCFRIHQCIKAFADAYAMLENELRCIYNDDDSGAKPKHKLLPKLIPSIAHFVGS